MIHYVSDSHEAPNGPSNEEILDVKAATIPVQVAVGIKACSMSKH